MKFTTQPYSYQKLLSILCLCAIIASSCSSSKNTAATKASAAKSDSLASARLIDSLNVMRRYDSLVKASSPKNETPTPTIAYENYRGAATIVNQLVHTELHVSFNYAKQYLYGKATITVKPYFYPADSLTLDAKGMDIHEVSLISASHARGEKEPAKSPLKYNYDGKQLHIGLNKTYHAKEQYKIYIDYTSKPNELVEEQSGSAAITSHKGLFFINPDGKDKNKPRQIWTQGETEDNSCWFPTIDKPNQRMTEEIYMTVEKSEKTLSNGELVSSTDNKDNTRTDHWEMKLGIPPYLVMMAIGPFSIIHDSWRGKPVDYYLDAKYAPYAKDIFGKTPQMMEFFSNILKFPYIWNKYDQVIVHDYVSGAMENATATLHGDFLNKTRRELIDDPLSTSEDIISHELFHHWFGDLVTCESWSNISLNESFADYSEYLWRQHAWGQDCADEYLRNSVSEYMNSPAAQHDLVDYNYNDREDVFDAISYNKGGAILNMLRNVVGDSAFFDALHLYLETNKFTAVQVSQLRLSFEKTTGQDLNWFFNEWFFNKGYPVLTIKHSYDQNNRKETVTIDQTQDLTSNPVFYMPLQIDIYYNGKRETHKVIMDRTNNTYSFDVPSSPDWVDVDAQKMLLSIKNEEMTLTEREFEYTHADSYNDRYEALTELSEHPGDAGAKAIMMMALHDKSWYLRKRAIQKLSHDTTPEFKTALISLTNDSSSNVRSEAISTLSENFHDNNLLSVYRKALNDSSYLVESNALAAITKDNVQEGLRDAHKLENTDEKELLLWIASIYDEYGNDSCNAFFLKISDKVNGYEQVAYVAIYGKFLDKCNDTTISRGIPVLGNILKNGDNKYSKMYAKRTLENLMSTCQDHENDLKGKIEELKNKKSGDPQIDEKRNRLKIVKANEDSIQSFLGE